jgi:spore maturation protein CgeB
MRAEWLGRITPSWEWQWIDTDRPMIESARVWQSLAYRYQSGLAVRRINELVANAIATQSFDLIWIDKAVFLEADTVRLLRKAATRLVHFTPDTAFGRNTSRHFERTIDEFDLLVTTKSFEVDEYARRVSRNKVKLISQGFDPLVHYPRNSDDARDKHVAFVGLAEPDREACVDELLKNGITVKLGGRGWDHLRARWSDNSNLIFVGDGIFGDKYAQVLSQSWVGVGLLSKRFPELHTTRTFEIPACGAILATEATAETTQFFHHDEAVFFSSYADLSQRVAKLFSGGNDELVRLANAGRARVMDDERDYKSLLGSIISDDRLHL